MRWFVQGADWARRNNKIARKIALTSFLCLRGLAVVEPPSRFLCCSTDRVAGRITFTIPLGARGKWGNGTRISNHQSDKIRHKKSNRLQPGSVNCPRHQAYGPTGPSSTRPSSGPSFSILYSYVHYFSILDTRTNQATKFFRFSKIQKKNWNEKLSCYWFQRKTYQHMCSCTTFIFGCVAGRRDDVFLARAGRTQAHITRQSKTKARDWYKKSYRPDVREVVSFLGVISSFFVGPIYFWKGPFWPPEKPMESSGTDMSKRCPYRNTKQI